MLPMQLLASFKIHEFINKNEKFDSHNIIIPGNIFNNE